MRAGILLLIFLPTLVLGAKSKKPAAGCPSDLGAVRAPSVHPHPRQMALDEAVDKIHQSRIRDAYINGLSAIQWDAAQSLAKFRGHPKMSEEDFRDAHLWVADYACLRAGLPRGSFQNKKLSLSVEQRIHIARTMARDLADPGALIAYAEIPQSRTDLVRGAEDPVEMQQVMPMDPARRELWILEAFKAAGFTPN